MGVDRLRSIVKSGIVIGVQNIQIDALDDAAFLGVQRRAGEAGFYDELLEAVCSSVLGVPSKSISILENPTRKLSAQTDSGPKPYSLPRVVLGGGLQNPYENPPVNSSLQYFGVRGYLTLNRLPNELEQKVVVGELGILASRLDIIPETTSDVVYAYSASQSPSGELLNRLDQIGAELVTFAEGTSSVLRKVKGAKLVISDGVIGLAVADGFGIPNVWHEGGASLGSKFQVMDYLEGVERASHLSLIVLPTEQEKIYKNARVANPLIIGSQCEQLIDRLEEAVRLQALHSPSDLIESSVNIDSKLLELPFPTSNAKSGKVELEYSYEGDKATRQMIMSFDLEAEGSIDIDGIGQIPKLYKSPNSDIGFYRYLTLERGNGNTAFVYDLPEGIVCRGIRVMKWADAEGELRADKIVHTLLG